MQPPRPHEPSIPRRVTIVDQFDDLRSGARSGKANGKVIVTMG